MFSYYKTLLGLLIIFSTFAAATDPDSLVRKAVRQTLENHARSSQARSSDFSQLATGLRLPRSFMEPVPDFVIESSLRSAWQPQLSLPSARDVRAQLMQSQSDSARLVTSLAESDNASVQTSQWKRAGAFSLRPDASNEYIPNNSALLNQIVCGYQGEDKSSPYLYFSVSDKATAASNQSLFYKELKAYRKKYNLLLHLFINKIDGQECIHEGLKIINAHLPFPDWMVEEICQFMQVGNPFIVKRIPQLCERWFSDIEQLYPSQIKTTLTENQQEKAQQEEKAIVEQIFKNILEEIAELRQEASHISIAEFLYPLAQKCESKYGIDDYFTRLISYKICELNPSDYTLRQRLAENLLVNGTPREAAVQKGLEELLALPKISSDIAPVLQHILDEKAGGRLGEEILRINFHQPTPAIAAQALNKLTEEVKQRRSLEEENESLKAEIERLKALQLSDTKRTDA